MITVEVTDDLEACLALRREVFIEEQNVPEEIEMDGQEDKGIHLLVRDADTPVGTARLMILGDIGKIGRVCVAKSHRGRGLGEALMDKALEVLRAQPGVTRAKLSAQTQVIGFYEGLGFEAHGPEYLDANIPHRDMYRPL